MEKSLTSLQNPRVKGFAALKDKKQREREQLYLVEGVRAVDTYLSCGDILQTLIYDDEIPLPDVALDLVFAARKKGVEVLPVGTNAIAKIADTEHPQGVIGVARMGDADWRAIVDEGEGDATVAAAPLLLLDGVKDPGNLGALLRSAHAVGCTRIVTLPGTVDVYSPKVVRAAMGSLPSLQIARMTDTFEELGARLNEEGYRVIGTDLDGTSLYEEDLTGKLALFIGSEADGLSFDASDLCERMITIPMPGKTESLNVAIAASVILYESLRQRLVRK